MNLGGEEQTIFKGTKEFLRGASRQKARAYCAVPPLRINKNFWSLFGGKMECRELTEESWFLYIERIFACYAHLENIFSVSELERLYQVS